MIRTCDVGLWIQSALAVRLAAHPHDVLVRLDGNAGDEQAGRVEPGVLGSHHRRVEHAGERLAVGAAIGALLIGLAEQLGLVYMPTYGIVLTFIIMVATLALRPQGIMGRARPARPSLPSIGPKTLACRPSSASARSCLAGASALSAGRVGILPHPDRRLFADLGPARAFDDAAGRLWRHGHLAQITSRRIAAYTIAIFGTNNIHVHGFGWPWWVLVPFAVLLAATASALIGAISVRTEGIYTIMITLAIAAAFFYFAQQNYTLFNGHSGYAGIPTPQVAGVNWRAPIPFYYLLPCGRGRLLCAVLYCSRSTFGLALQAIRDNGRRMRAVGFDITAHKVVAYFLAGIIAGLPASLVWFNGRVSPGTIDVGQAIEVLVIAVIGGLRHPIGPFIGAVFVILIQTFAIDIVGAERFNTLIGLFLAIVFMSPDGLLGLWGE